MPRARRRRLASLTPEQVVTLASLVERETPKRGRAPAGRGRVLQSAAARRSAAMRSDGAVRDGAGRPSGERRARRGFARRFAVQHLPASRPASGTNRQSGRSFAARRARARQPPIICISWPTTRAATSSAARSPNTIATWRAYRRLLARDNSHPLGTRQESAALRPLLNASHSNEDVRRRISHEEGLILEAARGTGEASLHPGGDRTDSPATDCAARRGGGKTSADYIVQRARRGGNARRLVHAIGYRRQLRRRIHRPAAFLDVRRSGDVPGASGRAAAKILRRRRAACGRARARSGAARAAPRGDDRAQPQSGRRESAREKEEIAHWFGIWLETPDAFFDWLEVRKQSPDFRRDFPTRFDDEE